MARCLPAFFQAARGPAGEGPPGLMLSRGAVQCSVTKGLCLLLQGSGSTRSVLYDGVPPPAQREQAEEGGSDVFPQNPVHSDQTVEEWTADAIPGPWPPCNAPAGHSPPPLLGAARPRSSGWSSWEHTSAHGQPWFTLPGSPRLFLPRAPSTQGWGSAWRWGSG